MESQIVSSVRSQLQHRTSPLMAAGPLAHEQTRQTLAALTDHLESCLQDDNKRPSERADAAFALGIAADESKRHNHGQICDEIRAAITALGEATAEQHQIIRDCAVRALGSFAAAESSTVVQILRSGQFAQEAPERLEGALSTLRQCDRHDVVRVIDYLCALLKPDEADEAGKKGEPSETVSPTEPDAKRAAVRCAACRVIQWLGELAVEARGLLINELLDARHDAIVKAAMSEALAAIPHTPEQIVRHVQDVKKLRELRNHIGTHTAQEKQLTKDLLDLESMVNQKRIPGFVYLQKSEIVRFVYDRELEGSEYDAAGRKIVDRIKAGELPAIRVKKGGYLVASEDLERLRRIYRHEKDITSPGDVENE